MNSGTFSARARSLLPRWAALILAAARRLFRPADAPLLPTIRSLAYFSPVIDEVLGSNLSQEYFLYLTPQAPTLRTNVQCQLLQSRMPLTNRLTPPAWMIAYFSLSLPVPNPVPALAHFY